MLAEQSVQYVAFKVHTEGFVLAMSEVREIIMLPPITFAPRVNPSIEGIFALRGEIIPVVNLRRMLGFERGATQPSTRVIIIQSVTGTFGIIVDEITDFLWLNATDIDAVAQNFFASEYRILNGLTKVGNSVKGILDIPALVSSLEKVQGSAA